MTEVELFNEARKVFVENTNIEFSDGDINQYANSHRVHDAVLKMKGAGAFVVEIKLWAQHKNTGSVINQIHRNVKAFNESEQQQAKPLLIADYINQRMAEDLQKANVNYIDTAGNAYIKSLPIFILIEGKKRIQENKLVKQGRAFNYSGLKIIYALLTNKEIINSNYREIAKRANVALGSVGWVIKDLTDNGYIEKSLINDEKKLTKYRELVEKWVETFPTLRKKIFIDEFIVQDPDWWKKAKNIDKNIILGGEYAGAEYTKNLKPILGAVYLDRENLNDYLVKYRLAKYLNTDFENGQIVQLFEKFWLDSSSSNEHQNLAHPILTYAELITSKEPRNREIANELAEKYIFD